MPFTTQQQNATTRLLSALAQLRDAYYDLMRADDGFDLIGIPALSDFPAPGDLDHLDRPKLVAASAVFEAFQTWMTTPIGPKTPLDAIVEALR